MAELNYMQRARLNGYRAPVGERVRRNSLIEDARVQRLIHDEQRRTSISQQRQRLKSESVDIHESAEEIQLVDKLDDEAIEVTYAPSEVAPIAPVEKQAESETDLIQDNNLNITHLETRQSDTSSTGHDLCVTCESTKPAYLHALAVAKNNQHVSKIDVHRQSEPVAWFPQHVSELDRCIQVVTKYEPTSDQRHPGFGDEEYINRRRNISQRALEYKYGDPLFDVHYTPAEQNVWTQVYTKLKLCHAQFACMEYKRNLQLLEDAGLYTMHSIPQLQPVCNYMRARTGFTLRPCGGLLSARDFLSSLSLRVFQATQYVRHHAKPHHSPEPDVIHELIGHVPMLCDPLFAQFSQEVGMASLGASDEQIEKLSTVYWFMIEFGLCWENGELKACGAGLLSSYGELLHAVSNKVEQRAFNPVETAVQAYSDDDYQSIYYVADSIQSAMEKLRTYASAIARPYQVAYCPYTQRILKVHSVNDCAELLDRVQHDVSSLSRIVNSLKSKNVK